MGSHSTSSTRRIDGKQNITWTRRHHVIIPLSAVGVQVARSGEGRERAGSEGETSGFSEKDAVLIARLIVGDERCDSEVENGLRLPPFSLRRGFEIVDRTLTSTRLATKMRIHDSGWLIRSSHRSDRGSEDLALFQMAWQAGKIPETPFLGMLVLREHDVTKSSQSCL